MTFDYLYNLLSSVKEYINEIQSTLVGPPGPPGKGRIGRPGPPGSQGARGTEYPLIFEFSITKVSFKVTPV